jgi:hypothetical protein
MNFFDIVFLPIHMVPWFISKMFCYKKSTPARYLKDSVTSFTNRNWVNVEWGLPLTERDSILHREKDSIPIKMQQGVYINYTQKLNSPLFSIFFSFGVDSVDTRFNSVFDSVDKRSHSALTQLMGCETPCQLSHRRTIQFWISQWIQKYN